MQWGSVVIDAGMGPAAKVIVQEYERRCSEFGVGSVQAKSLAASELGFEHNLGLLHGAYQVRALRPMRQGVVEHEYYLERCLLEAEGASFSERGLVMCASVVGDDMAEQMYSRVFGRDLQVEIFSHLQVPELVLHPASAVGACAPAEQCAAHAVDGDQYPPGFCYLALFQAEFVTRALNQLGPDPKLRDVVQFGDAGAFLPDVQLAQLSLRRVKSGYHVDTGCGLAFTSVVQCARIQMQATEWIVDGARVMEHLGVGADAAAILTDWISASVGAQVQLSEASLDLVTNSAALLDRVSKQQLRTLESVGDAALSMMIARDNHLRGESVERYQTLRSFVTSNKVLSDKFVQHVPAGAVRFASGVNPSAGVTGAKALESILGAIWMELGDEALAKMLVALGILDFHLRVSPNVLALPAPG